MENDVLDTKGKLLQTAIDMFGLKAEVTVREITEKAGVNVSAINYYFGNKNNLLKEVEEHYANILNNIQHEIFHNKALNSSEKLIKWAQNLIEFLFRYPAIVGLITDLSTEDKSYRPSLIQRVYLNKEVTNIIDECIMEITGSKDLKFIRYKHLQIFSGILGVIINNILANTFYKGTDVIGIRSSDELEEYVEMFIKDALTKSL